MWRGRDGILVVLRLEQIIPCGLDAAGPIRRKYSIRWKALKRLVIAKHVVEKIVGRFDFTAFLRLIIDNPDPRTDA